MGYRERRAHKSQQKQESLGQSYTPEKRIDLPVPITINSRDNQDFIGPSGATNIVGAIPHEDGLYIPRSPQTLSFLQSTSVDSAHTFVSYFGSGTASAELWLIGPKSGNHHIWNIGEIIDGGTTTTASSNAAPSSATGGSRAGSWVEFNKTIIYCNGFRSYKWNRASAWEDWSASVSAGAANEQHEMTGITKFKNRLISWKNNDTAFYYGSTDQIIGNLNRFELSPVVDGVLKTVDSITRDGGSGFDDFLFFATDAGEVAVYQGTDPGDANAWSLVGVYKVGVPVSKNGTVKYGQQTILVCSDDYYFLPDDLQGKRQPTEFNYRLNGVGDDLQLFKGIYWPERGIIIFSDGTVIDPQKNYGATTLKVASAEPYELQQKKILTVDYVDLTLYKNKLYMTRKIDGDLVRIQELMPVTGSRHDSFKLTTGSIPTSGRTNISLINPRFDTKNNYASTTANASSTIVYKVAVEYDKNLRRDESATNFVTATASGDTIDQWLPGFGTGNNAQICIELISASTSADLYIREIRITASDTGGI